DATRWREDLAAEESAMAQVFASLRTMEQVRRHVAGQPDLASEALAGLDPDGDAEDNHLWWAALSPAQQRAVITSAPEVIGNLDGRPAAARGEANRARRNGDIERWQNLLDRGVSDPDTRADIEQRLDNALAARDALENLGERADPVTGDPVVAHLYTYDP